MGDRANIVIWEHSQPRWVYTHWAGHRIGNAIKLAILEVGTASLVDYLVGDLAAAHECRTIDDYSEQDRNPMVEVNLDQEYVQVHRITHPGGLGPQGIEVGSRIKLAEYLMLDDPDRWIREQAAEGGGHPPNLGRDGFTTGARWYGVIGLLDYLAREVA